MVTDHFPSLRLNVVYKILLNVFKNTAHFSLILICQTFLSSLYAEEGDDLCGKSGQVCAKPADIPLKVY